MRTKGSHETQQRNISSAKQPTNQQHAKKWTNQIIAIKHPAKSKDNYIAQDIASEYLFVYGKQQYSQASFGKLLRIAKQLLNDGINIEKLFQAIEIMRTREPSQMYSLGWFTEANVHRVLGEYSKQKKRLVNWDEIT